MRRRDRAQGDSCASPSRRLPTAHEIRESGRGGGQREELFEHRLLHDDLGREVVARTDVAGVADDVLGEIDEGLVAADVLSDCGAQDMGRDRLAAEICVDCLAGREVGFGHS
ncbi:hypothetical protein AGR2A_Cc120092 [Agrobacterium genomosp. 2 str. CFBP 5494]|uniref:Uncharacterized protein n=1 Tax=Agrobacterium genomosp. 2 str. CFBP 5494 TaxID=1183436 RepID=A0A9W5AYL6_9HYPH|nr:hypothetical protein AGR2A_Cc120092 [Agrobacterium genomosp. 2 str. CFBP 5494]